MTLLGPIQEMIVNVGFMPNIRCFIVNPIFVVILRSFKDIILGELGVNLNPFSSIKHYCAVFNPIYGS